MMTMMMMIGTAHDVEQWGQEAIYRFVLERGGLAVRIQTVLHEVRGLMNVGAETWAIPYEYKCSTDDSERELAEKNAGV